MTLLRGLTYSINYTSRLPYMHAASVSYTYIYYCRLTTDFFFSVTSSLVREKVLAILQSLPKMTLSLLAVIIYIQRRGLKLRAPLSNSQCPLNAALFCTQRVPDAWRKWHKISERNWEMQVFVPQQTRDIFNRGYKGIALCIQRPFDIETCQSAGYVEPNGPASHTPTRTRVASKI